MPEAGEFIEPGFIEEGFFEGGAPSSRARHPAVAPVKRIAHVPRVRRVVVVKHAER